MNINRIFSTKERIKIIKHVIYKANTFGVSDTARELGLSKALISKYFENLANDGIIKKENSKFLVRDNVKAKSIKILLNLNEFDISLFKKYKFVLGVGLYGSLTKGTNNEDSDIDIWVKIKETNQLELANLTNKLSKRYKNIKPLFLTIEKIEMLKKEDPLFFYSLIFGSIKLYGGELEI